jgi:AraC-like DNA-binding protein
MKSKNICKFIPETAADTLEMQNFVYEMDQAVMGAKTLLTCDRAILVTQGSGTFYFDNAQIKLSLGSLVFGFKGETVFCEPSENLEYIYISFGGARANTLFTRFGIYKSNRSFCGFEGMIPVWRESILRASETSIDLASESALLYAFSRFSSEEKEKGDVVNNAVTYINENFTEPELSLTELAEELGYNSKYLSHLFKEKMGMSFSEYLRTVRIKHAVMLFDHGLDSVKNVALLSGFSDPLYFSSVFKAEVGISPKEYIKK